LPEGLREYVRVPLPGGLTMGVIGLTAPWGGAYQIFGLHLPDFCQVAQDLVDRLREGGARPVVVLSHLGLEDDRRLAQAVAGIDLIVGAHSHHRLPEGEVCHGVLIAQTGDYAQALGRVDLTLDPATGYVLDRSAQVLDVPPDQEPDPVVLEAIAAAEREVDSLMAQPLGGLESALDLDHFGECGIGNLAADALRERTGAEVAMVASGLFHAGLPAGTISLGQLDAACFSTANPCLTEVRGAQILTALERGLDPALSQTMHPSFRGTPVGAPHISGMRVEYDPGGERGHRVRRVVVGEEGLDPERLYRLAHTDAETMAEVGYLVLDEDQETKTEVPTILREVIEEYLVRHSPLPRPIGGRWLAAGE
jgi:2',3'-cyclic-nucleotide 2'-phosphodiesterase (5'-nucleotidase family)